MKVLVLGVINMAGTSKKTGTGYDMFRVITGSEITAVSREGFQRRGAGYEPADIDLAPEAFNQFTGFKYPVVLDLETDMRLSGGKLVPICIGVKEKAAA